MILWRYITQIKLIALSLFTRRRRVAFSQLPWTLSRCEVAAVERDTSCRQVSRRYIEAEVACSRHRAVHPADTVVACIFTHSSWTSVYGDVNTEVHGWLYVAASRCGCCV